MTAALAATASGFAEPLAPLRPRRDDRWLTRDRRSSRWTRPALVAAGGSLLLHALVFALIMNGGVPSRPPPAPITVELVQAAPEPPKTPEAKSPASEVSAPTVSPPKLSAPPAPKQEAAVPPPQLKPTLPPPAQPVSPAPPKATPAGESLQDELAKLKAEQASLQAALRSEQAELQRAQDAPPAAPSPGGSAADGRGLLPESFQAVALPTGSTGEGEAVSYPELVFSQLAKAKGIGREQGQPGTAGVRFDIDASGRLLDVELATSSGIKALDDEALAMVRKAAPFPPPPAGARRSFSANVSFIADKASR